MHCVIAILVWYVLVYFFSKVVKFVFFLSTKDQTKLSACEKMKGKATFLIDFIALKVKSGKGLNRTKAVNKRFIRLD